MRAAIVRVSSPNRPCSTLKRPVQFLYPLEISSASVYPVATQDPDHSKSASAEKKEDSADTTNQVRPRRAAAREDDKVRRAWIAQLEDHEGRSLNSVEVLTANLLLCLEYRYCYVIVITYSSCIHSFC